MIRAPTTSARLLRRGDLTSDTTLIVADSAILDIGHIPIAHESGSLKQAL